MMKEPSRRISGMSCGTQQVVERLATSGQHQSRDVSIRPASSCDRGAPPCSQRQQQVADSQVCCRSVARSISQWSSSACGTRRDSESCLKIVPLLSERETRKGSSRWMCLKWIQEGCKGGLLRKHLNTIRVACLGDSVPILGSARL